MTFWERTERRQNVRTQAGEGGAADPLLRPAQDVLDYERSGDVARCTWGYWADVRSGEPSELGPRPQAWGLASFLGENQPVTDDQRAQAQALAADHMPYREIAATLGIAVSTAHKWAGGDTELVRAIRWAQAASTHLPVLLAELERRAAP